MGKVSVSIEIYISSHVAYFAMQRFYDDGNDSSENIPTESHFPSYEA